MVVVNLVDELVQGPRSHKLLQEVFHLEALFRIVALVLMVTTMLSLIPRGLLRVGDSR